MRLLPDVHALVWWLLDDISLSRTAREALGSAGETFVSAVSAFEMVTRHRAGKWQEVRRLLDTFQRAMDRENFILLEVKVDHSILGGLMDGSHRDPFDRLLAAQTKVEELVLVTRNPAFAGFDIRTLW